MRGETIYLALLPGAAPRPPTAAAAAAVAAAAPQLPSGWTGAPPASASCPASPGLPAPPSVNARERKGEVDYHGEKTEGISRHDMCGGTRAGVCADACSCAGACVCARLLHIDMPGSSSSLQHGSSPREHQWPVQETHFWQLAGNCRAQAAGRARLQVGSPQGSDCQLHIHVQPHCNPPLPLAPCP